MLIFKNMSLFKKMLRQLTWYRNSTLLFCGFFLQFILLFNRKTLSSLSLFLTANTKTPINVKMYYVVSPVKIIITAMLVAAKDI
jgi:hypothetical protein